MNALAQESTAPGPDAGTAPTPPNAAAIPDAALGMAPPAAAPIDGPTALDAAAQAAAHDLSFLSLFLQADPIVKGVMILLIVASICCWTVIFDKMLRLRAARRQARIFDEATRTGQGVDRIPGIPGRVIEAGFEAWRDQDPTESRAERRDRIERAMRLQLGVELRRMQRGLPFLATTGSTAPFIGLFGTVWGIMNSFSAIAKSQDTSLSVVAPGIAEALFATAIGLVAAIPAVMAYNKLSGDLGRLNHWHATAIARLSDRLARDRVGIARAEAAE